MQDPPISFDLTGLDKVFIHVFLCSHLHSFLLSLPTFIPTYLTSNIMYLFIISKT